MSNRSLHPTNLSFQSPRRAALALLFGLGAGTLGAQQPTSGSTPALQLGSFNMSVNAAVCANAMDTALRLDKLTQDYNNPGVRIAQNNVVSLAVTCSSEPSGVSRVVVVASSTVSSTSEWYRNDIRTRIQQVAAGQPATGNGNAAPTTGNVVPLQLGTFSLKQYYPTGTPILTLAQNAATDAGLQIGYNGGRELIAQNAHVALVAATVPVQYLPNIPPPTLITGGEVDTVTIIASSTDSSTAEWFRNTVRTYTQTPPGPPVVVR